MRLSPLTPSVLWRPSPGQGLRARNPGVPPLRAARTASAARAGGCYRLRPARLGRAGAVRRGAVPLAGGGTPGGGGVGGAGGGTRYPKFEILNPLCYR